MINKFVKLPINKKILLIKACFITALTRIVIVLLPFKFYKSFLGNNKKEHPISPLNTKVYRDLHEIRWAILTVSKYTPWKSLCLVQALTCKIMIRKYNLKTTIYLGVNNKNRELKAHAWIRCGDMYITGGNGDGYGVVAYFSS